MRYVLNMGRTPKGLPRFCAFCCEPIEDKYLRELATRIIYCEEPCYAAHVHAASVTFGGYEAPKLLTYGRTK